MVNPSFKTFELQFFSTHMHFLSYFHLSCQILWNVPEKKKSNDVFVQRDDSVRQQIFKMSLSGRDVKRFEVNAICWCSDQIPGDQTSQSQTRWILKNVCILNFGTLKKLSQKLKRKIRYLSEKWLNTSVMMWLLF